MVRVTSYRLESRLAQDRLDECRGTPYVGRWCVELAHHDPGAVVRPPPVRCVRPPTDRHIGHGVDGAREHEASPHLAHDRGLGDLLEGGRLYPSATIRLPLSRTYRRRGHVRVRLQLLATEPAAEALPDAEPASIGRAREAAQDVDERSAETFRDRVLLRRLSPRSRLSELVTEQCLQL